MKKKVLLSSFLTIALCFSLIAGSTFALFTSQSEVNIAVTAGKVEMVANIEDFKLYSVEANENGTVVDENGGKYEYVERTDGKFINGGTAVLNGSVITLDNITPGDKISFGIDGINNSDVTVQSRYIIQCAGDEALMKGLLVYIDGVAYPALKSYTSAWTALEVGTSITDTKNIEIVVELPVTAGNEYQDKTTSINVLVEAVQGNAVVSDSQTIAQFLDGKVDLDDMTVANTVANYGEVEIVDGTISVNNSGFENFGTATLTGTTVAAGTAGTKAYGYAYIGREGSTTVLNDVTVKSANGAIAAENGAQVTMNSGYVEVDSQNTSGRYLIYAVGEGTVVTVNGGEFFFNKTQNQKRAYAYVGEGATLYINGGSFGTASTRDGYTAGILTENDQAKVIITGGTFGFDPSAWVATGYKVTKLDGKYYVTEEAINIANNSDTLVEALENGKDVFMLNDVKIEPANMSNAYGTTGINVKNGQTIDGNGNTLDIKGAGGTWDSGINTTGGLIKNITVTGSFRGIFINHNSAHSEKVVLENVIIDGTVYTISCDQGANQGLEATNSTFNGWTSYAGTLGYAKFVDCSFGEGSGYAFCRPYAPTEFVGCDFEAGFQIDARAAVTFENCTIGGVELTAENLATLVTYNTANASVK